MRTSIVKGTIYWVSTKAGMPAPNVPVLIEVNTTTGPSPSVSAGVAFHDGDNWYTYMKPDHPKFDKPVSWWAPLPN
jgi:hypothetical protein